jgi:hypothetical protein
MKKSLMLMSFGLLTLAACSSPYGGTPRPDYTIRVVPTPNGPIAVAPTCPSWATDTSDPFDNQPIPQFGCANARNLALMVEQPEDLVKGRDLGPARATTTVGAIRRYDNNQTRGLLDPDTSPDMAAAVTTSSTASSSLSGDATGSASSSSSSAPAAAAAAP